MNRRSREDLPGRGEFTGMGRYTGSRRTRHGTTERGDGEGKKRLISYSRRWSSRNVRTDTGVADEQELEIGWVLAC